MKTVELEDDLEMTENWIEETHEMLREVEIVGRLFELLKSMAFSVASRNIERTRGLIGEESLERNGDIVQEILEMVRIHTVVSEFKGLDVIFMPKDTVLPLFKCSSGLGIYGSITEYVFGEGARVNPKDVKIALEKLESMFYPGNHDGFVDGNNYVFTPRGCCSLVVVRGKGAIV